MSGVNDVVDGVLGDAVFGVGDERYGLLGLVLRIELIQVRVQYLLYLSLLVYDTNLLAAAVADGGGLQDVAELVHLQRQRMTDARIYRVALVVVVDGFAGMGEEHRMAVPGLRLQAPDGEVLLGDGVGMLLLVRAVQSVDLLAQHRAFQGAAGFALFLGRQPGGQRGVW